MLGKELTEKISDLFDVLAFSKKQYNGINPFSSLSLDIRDKDVVYDIFKKFKPDIVINCAAFTDVDKSETKKTLARDVNVKGLSNIIKSLPRKSKIIHISTDYVFDGKYGNYKEDDIKSPLNYYGKTKLEAENLLIGSNYDYLIIRPNVLYSNDMNENHFLDHVYIVQICVSLSLLIFF